MSTVMSGYSRYRDWQERGNPEMSAVISEKILRYRDQNSDFGTGKKGVILNICCDIGEKTPISGKNSDIASGKKRFCPKKAVISGPISGPISEFLL